MVSRHVNFAAWYYPVELPFRHPTTKLPVLFLHLVQERDAGDTSRKNGSNLISIQQTNPSHQEQQHSDRFNIIESTLKATQFDLIELLPRRSAPSLLTSYHAQFPYLTLLFLAKDFAKDSPSNNPHSRESHCRSGNKLNGHLHFVVPVLDVVLCSFYGRPFSTVTSISKVIS